MLLDGIHLYVIPEPLCTCVCVTSYASASDVTCTSFTVSTRNHEMR